MIDPASETDACLDIGFLDGKVAAVEQHIAPQHARRLLDARGHIVVPGLVDLHSHIYWGGTALGVDAASVCGHSGTTTFVDAGSAGAGNFPGFKRFIVERSRLNIFAFLNVSFAGIFGCGENLWVGECADLRLLDSDKCHSVVAENRDVIVGIKVRLGEEASGRSGIRPLEIAREIADRLDVPIMTHIDMPPPTVLEVLSLMRAGDIWTHCFRGPPNCIVSSSGEVEQEILQARRRGVLFDVGHGFGSFSFDVARQMIGRGIYPDTISSDVHAMSVNGPAFDVLHTASKFLSLGMPLEAVIARISCAPARCIRQHQLGRLAPGCVGDAVVLEVQQGAFEFTDSHKQKLIGEQRLRPHAIVRAGALWEEHKN